jgi:hypothetical protein
MTLGVFLKRLHAQVGEPPVYIVVIQEVSYFLLMSIRTIVYVAILTEAISTDLIHATTLFAMFHDSSPALPIGRAGRQLKTKFP